MKQKTKKSFGFLYMIPAVLLIGILLISGYRALKIYIPQMRDQQKFEALKEMTEPDPTVVQEDQSAFPAGKYDKLLKKNKYLVGWIAIPDTKIDYPVVKTGEDNPQLYLRRDFEGKYSVGGTLFVGGGCDHDSDIFIIYGHNMPSGTMFGELDKYADAQYALKHQTITYDTLTERRTYRVFAAFRSKIYKDSDSVFKYYETIGSRSEQDYNDAVEGLCGLSAIDLGCRPTYPQQILLLSTCSYHTESGRFAVAAYRVD